MDFRTAEKIILLTGMVFLSVTVIFCIVRAFLGPRFTDRLLAINVIGVKTVILICISILYLDEGYVADIALVYATISFLSSVMLAKIFLNYYLKKKGKSNKEVKGGEM